MHPFPFTPRYGITDIGGGYNSFGQPLIVGNDVWIAANAVITRGCSIGDGAVVGASAVVTHDIPPYEIWAGVPAKKIGQRFSDKIIAELMELKWWEFSDEILRENVQYFTKNLSIDDIRILKKIKQDK